MTDNDNHSLLGKTLLNSIIGWIFIIFATGASALVALHYYEIVSPTDPEALLRSMLLRIPMMAIGIMMLLGSLIAADLIIPGEGLHMIGSDPRAYAIMMAALLIAVAIVCAYA